MWCEQPFCMLSLYRKVAHIILCYFLQHLTRQFTHVYPFIFCFSFSLANEEKAHGGKGGLGYPWRVPCEEIHSADFHISLKGDSTTEDFAFVSTLKDLFVAFLLQVESEKHQDVVVYDQSTRDASGLASDSFLSILLGKLDSCFHNVFILTGRNWQQWKESMGKTFLILQSLMHTNWCQTVVEDCLILSFNAFSIHRPITVLYRDSGLTWDIFLNSWSPCSFLSNFSEHGEQRNTTVIIHFSGDNSYSK